MDIFEYLQNMFGCTCISDLKFGAYKDMAIEILKQMDISNISPRQIADAEAYFGIALA